MKNVLILVIIVLAAVMVVVVRRASENGEVAERASGYFEKLGGALEQAQELNLKSVTIDMSGQGLTRLTTEFFEGKAQVKAFNVAHNNLTGALPAEIRKMERLETLNASDNGLTGIPAEIGQLDYIREIHFSNNNIDTYPNEFADIADTLKLLNLSGNNFREETRAQLRTLLPNTQVVF